jgi:hypothetical protein
MAYDYTALPTTTELADLLAAAGLSDLSTDVPANLRQAFLDASKQRIEKETRRQFVPGSAGEVRYYDGSGTGLLEIDEYIDITAVEFIQLPPAASYTISNFYEVSQQGAPKTILEIYQGQPNLTLTYANRFEVGRSNIKVTGQFGYASSIPADVYLAIMQGAAAMMADEYSVSTGGGLMLKSWTNADRKEDYDTSRLVSEVAGWKKNVEATIKRYRRPQGAFRRRNTPPMI